MGNEQTTGKRLNGYWSIIALGVTLILNLGVAASQLWVKSGYVPREEFESYKTEQLQRRESTTKDLKDIAVDIGKINVQMGANDRQDKRLDDLEHRMNDQERKR